jgi:hypothetical protein
LCCWPLRRVLGKGAKGIDGGTADADLEVEMRSGRVPGRADEPDANSLGDPHADAYVQA